ncbi:MAG TPA: hemerythrin domain-containing protein [Microlunatus sp.]
MTTTQHPRIQLTLPGQSHTAEGQHDHTGMYVMHYGFRRDLANLASAVANTPLGDTATWAALQQRWQLFSDILHHHHAAEDDYYWPALSAAVQVRGTADDHRLVAAMQDEHAGIDPALSACAAGLADLQAHPCESHRAALEVRIVTFREALDQHLTHEESETLPLVQRVMTAAEFAASERSIERHAYPPRMVPVVLPWAWHRLPSDAAARMQASVGPVLRLLHRLLRGGFERRERMAFRYSDVLLPD